MSFQDAFMDTLKDRYTEVVGTREFGGCDSKTQARYYLKRLEDNLCHPMSAAHVAEYSRGSGSELNGKMKSLRSSSAMTFNLLGNGPVAITGEGAIPSGTYSIEYEHQLPTLARNPNPANLDAKLYTPDGACSVFCEMKLAEWLFSKAGGLRSPYLNSENYLIPHTSATVFARVFSELVSSEKDRSGRHVPVLERYDALQMLKHLLAIYTWCAGLVEAGEPAPPKVVLANCVWEMKHPEKLGRFEEKYRALEDMEHAQYAAFATAAAPITELFNEIGCDLSLRYYSFSQFLDLLELDHAHRAALERYLV